MAPENPTSAWLAAAPYLPPLEGPADVAGRLVLLLHFGIDWEHGWVGRRRVDYWAHLLTSRIYTATYRAATLRAWWTAVARELEAAPRTRAQREELGVLLGGGDGLEVLAVLREEHEALALRCRIVADAVRDQRQTTERTT